jgi:membrane peptidoglycan carboxypeptidase
MVTVLQSRVFRLLIAAVAGGSLGGLLAVAAYVAVFQPWWDALRDETMGIVAAHVAHDVSHPGWSFPARVWSDSTPIDGLSKERLAIEASARGYTEACPPANPGEYCPKDGAVVLRGGPFPEGEQPAGNTGWTRSLALEPVLLGELVGPDSEIREHLPVEEAPPVLIAAIIAAEDDDFYTHAGIDVTGLVRATLANLRGGGYAQGGSTLTMQVVRNLTGAKERTIGRKVREIGEALIVDRALGKAGVMQIYLDAPYLGQSGNLSICGFQAAARYYWGVDAKELSLAQAATLAAILPAPGRFAPDRAPELAKERRDRVLHHMAETGWDAAAVDAALAEPVTADPQPQPGEQFPAYLQATRMALEEALPPATVYGSGLQVWTAMDPGIQAVSEELLAERVQYLEKMVGRRGEGPLLTAGAIVRPSDGALITVVDPTLETSMDFDRATQARRQAGSSFKPMVYALAFQPGDDGKPRFRPDDSLPNTPRSFGGTDGWSPRNVGGRYTATSSLAYGLAASQNIATATLLEKAGGPEPLIELATKIGFDTKDFPHEMGLALGQAGVTPLEMARMVATFVGGGRRLSASPILSAVDADGTVRLALPAPGDAVLTPDSALLTRELMALVVQFGTGGSVHGGGGFPGYVGDIVGKTGTADDEKDLWFVGSTPDYSAAVWLGYDEPFRIGGSASDLAAPLFGWWMRAVHEGIPHAKFDESGVEKHWICNQTGLIPGPNCKGITAPFLPGTKPRGVCPSTHDPETGESMEAHISLWQRLAGAVAPKPDEPEPPPEDDFP